MRPPELNPLFAPLGSLTGIAARLSGLFEKLIGGPYVADLLWHLPTGVIDRRFMPKVKEAEAGRVVSLHVRIDAHIPADTPRRPYRVRCMDETGFVTLTFFHAKPDWLRKALPIGEYRIVSGQVEFFNGECQMAHPDRIVKPEDWSHDQAIEAIYPLGAGLGAKIVAKAIANAVARLPDLPDWQNPDFVAREAWPTWRQAVQSLHRPQSEADIAPSAPARRRLAYDELLANQLALALVRDQVRRLRGRSLQGDGRLRGKILEALPFALTGAQKRSLAEIEADMAAPLRMLRLLQGDVGSGKTVVALLAMANAIETGGQAALMAPTEILARQHFATLQRLAAPAGIEIGLLTGRDKGKARQKILDSLADGRLSIIVGTHALFQEHVQFHNLVFAVIDEQHRFGVQQRLDLAAKGQGVDMLVMTATPIPRTLMLTAYGDMDVSRLDEKPVGRKPIDTRVVSLSRLDEVMEGVRRAIGKGAKAYWICPLVEESEDSDLAAVDERHQVLSSILGSRVAVIHGRMKGPEKDLAMAAFAGDDADILVATTVVEVGVDVPAATIMVIEHAERFGLAQLHQLRGRIGRGDQPSTCILLYGFPLSEVGRARLNIMRDTQDGFVIAEEDLKLRGGGELLGTRQSGLPEFKLADLLEHGDLLAVARDEARAILNEDPDLKSKRGERLRTLLYLFRRDEAVKTLRSG